MDLETDAMHFWISRDKGTLLMSSQNNDGTSNIGVFLKLKGEKNSWEFFQDNRMHLLQSYLIDNHPDLDGIIHLDPEIIQNLCLTRIITLKVSPWSNGKFTILGDAAHTMNPFGGLGVNFGIEDV